MFLCNYYWGKILEIIITIFILLLYSFIHRIDGRFHLARRYDVLAQILREVQEVGFQYT